MILRKQIMSGIWSEVSDIVRLKPPTQTSNFYLLMRAAKKLKVFCCQGANCSIASHGSFWTKKTCSCERPPRKLDKCTINSSRVWASKRLRYNWREISSLTTFRAHTNCNRTCQGKLVDRTHKKVNLSRKLVKKNVLVCARFNALFYRHWWPIIQRTQIFPRRRAIHWIRNVYSLLSFCCVQIYPKISIAV